MVDFDSKAATWDSDPMKRERARVAADAIRAALPDAGRMRALEYGCGTGLLSFELKDLFEHITLADTSPGMISVLTKKIYAAEAANMSPLLLDENARPLAANAFDAIYSMMALHHIDDVAGTLRDFHMMLRSEGWLGVIDLDREDGSFHGEDAIDVHLGFDRDEFGRMVMDAGFGEPTFKTLFTITKGGRKYPVFMMSASKRA